MVLKEVKKTGVVVLVGLLSVALGQEIRLQSCGLAQASTEVEMDAAWCAPGRMNQFSAPIVFEKCCGDLTEADDFRRLLRSGSEPRRLANEECRSVSTTNAYCDTDENPECEQYLGANDKLTINLNMFSTAEDPSCCRHCMCFGDPECASFDGTRDEWIVCDSRTKDSCNQNQNICGRTLDHKGNNCVWKNGWAGWHNSGSPCQANWTLSGYPRMTMYTNEELTVELVLGERGVIISVEITLANGPKYTLESSRCFEYDPRIDGVDPLDAWVSSNGQVPSTWRATTPNPVEVQWNIDAVGIHLTATCSRSFSETSDMTRINVHFVETQERAISGGFCETGLIEEKSGTRLQVSKDIHEYCLSQNLDELLYACKSLYGTEECTAWNLDQKLAEWCQKADLQLTSSTTQDCINKITGSSLSESDKVLNFATMLCQANQLNVDQCVTEISQFGFDDFFAAHSDGLIDEGNEIMTCTSNVGSYGVSSGSCETGIRVEYLKDGVWIERFYIPTNSPPCNGRIEVTAEDFPELFLYPFRFIQCGLSSECLVGQTDTDCRPANGFDVQFRFNTVDCPTPKPTLSPSKNPTKSPTDSPTKAPTKSPTKKPTKTPTESPTKNPTKSPTEKPTKSPTKSPTEKPTKSPTKTPTDSPTKSPSKRPTQSPIQTGAPSKSPTPRPTGEPTESPTKKPTKSPTKTPSKSPTGAPVEKCDVVCPNDNPPAPEEGMAVSTTDCTMDLEITMDVLTSDSYCGCEFSQDDISDDGHSVNLQDACEEMWEDDDRENLEKTCQMICQEMYSNDQNDANDCDAWEYDATTGSCSVYSCTNEDAQFVETSDDTTSGKPCVRDITKTQPPTCYVCTEENTNNPQHICEDEPSAPVPIGTCDSCCFYDNILNPSFPDQCREVTLDKAYCDMDKDTEAIKCEMLSDNGGVLTVQVDLDYDGVNELECCKTCSCWGDPLCSSFSGQTDKWILCDARKSDCIVSSSVCSSQKDHMGNKCVWDSTIASKVQKKRSDIGAYGSPCTPDWAKSGPAKMTMYSIENFGAEITMGERGVIESLIIRSGSNTFTLEASKCFDSANADGLGAFTSSSSSSQITDSLRVDITDGPGRDQRSYRIVDTETLIMMKVACLRNRASNGFVGGYRLNVQNLVEVDPDRTMGGSAEGYCVNNAIDKMESTTDVTEAVYDTCQEDLGDLHLFCKELWHPSCTPADVPRAVNEWCSTANLYGGTNPSKCVSTIGPNGSNKNRVMGRWVALYCEAIGNQRTQGLSLSSWIKQCVSMVQGQGASEMVSLYGTGQSTIGSLDNPNCAESELAYTKRSPEQTCVQGISVEYFKDGVWHEEVFMPLTLSPCSGSVDFTAKNHFNLFVYPIRFRQCDVGASCPIDEGCLPAQGYDLSYKFKQDAAVCLNTSVRMHDPSKSAIGSNVAVKTTQNVFIALMMMVIVQLFN